MVSLKVQISYNSSPKSPVSSLVTWLLLISLIHKLWSTNILLLLLSKLVSVRLIRNNTNKCLFYPHLFPFLMLFLSFHRSGFLNYIISLLSEECLTFFCKAGLLATHFLNFCLSKRLFISSSLVSDIISGKVVFFEARPLL